MQVVILAGGLGKRLGHLTSNIPKPMISIKEKPFLWYLIKYLKKQCLKEILICTGYKAERITSYFKDGSKFGVDVKYSHEKNPLGTGGALKNAERYLNEEFMLLNGDTFIPLNFKNLINYFKNSSGKNIIVVNKDKQVHGNIKINGEKMVIGYDKVQKKFKYNDCGVQVFRKEIIKLIPRNRIVSLENDIFPLLIRKNNLVAFEAKTDFFDLGTFEGLHRFKKVVDKYF